MRTLFKISVLTVILVMGVISGANAEPQVIDKLEIVAIREMKVTNRGGDFALDMVAVIRNSGSQETRIRDGNFTFYMSSMNKDANPPRLIEEKKQIGVDYKHEEILLLTGENDQRSSLSSGTVPGGESEVLFHVNIGRSTKQAFESLSHILNCIGKPNPVRPRIYIAATFELGVLSNKGWSMVENTKIEWVFDPEVQESVNFMTLDKSG